MVQERGNVITAVGNDQLSRVGHPTGRRHTLQTLPPETLAEGKERGGVGRNERLKKKFKRNFTSKTGVIDCRKGAY